MNESDKKIEALMNKLDELLAQQVSFNSEINLLKSEIQNLKSDGSAEEVKIESESEPKVLPTRTNIPAANKISAPVKTDKKSNIPEPGKINYPKAKSNIEKFIGENLINKIGIAITVIGVAIGAKYAIDNQLISPLTRIIIGYLVGLGLMAFAIKLKKNYHNYSAVLLSGAMAIMYFISFAAYSFYDLFPQVFTFVLMVAFTLFTVYAALQYNQKVIAHIGLVGAYAVPFLLSDGSGRVLVLFSYMAIINIGILVVGYKKYWKSLYYSSFILTWLIYSSWYASRYDQPDHFALSLVFLTLFYTIFYLTFILYKLVQKEQFGVGDIFLLLFNAFIFYGLGYTILNDHDAGKHLLGVFTLANAAVHFAVSLLIYRHKLADKKLLYLVTGLVLIFITITVPVQLDGNWVTLLWAGEAALLFWIGRTKKVNIYEQMSYPLMILAFISILQDWANQYHSYSGDVSHLTPIFNINFLSSILFIGAFSFINVINYKGIAETKNAIYRIFQFVIPSILLIILFNAFRLEIAHFFKQQYINSEIEINGYGSFDEDISHFKTIWLINYTLVFLIILSWINITKIKSRILGLVTLGINAYVMFFFLVDGLLVLSDLRVSWLIKDEYFVRGGFNIGIRYISIALFGVMLYTNKKYLNVKFISLNFSKIYDLTLHLCAIWVASSELVHWMDIFRSDSTEAYKLGLSIFWGLYALFLIILGISQKKKHLRIAAIALFAVTLLKLFFYDISELATIAKTIVFVSLGILLLIISFLYNKYKHLIFDEDQS